MYEKQNHYTKQKITKIKNGQKIPKVDLTHRHTLQQLYVIGLI